MFERLSKTQKSWLATAFSIPASFSILTIIIPESSLSEILSRIVLSYRKFIEGVAENISAYINLDITNFAGTIVLFLFLIISYFGYFKFQIIETQYGFSFCPFHVLESYCRSLIASALFLSNTNNTELSVWISSFVICVFLLFYLSFEIIRKNKIFEFPMSIIFAFIFSPIFYYFFADDFADFAVIIGICSIMAFMSFCESVPFQYKVGMRVIVCVLGIFVADFTLRIIVPTIIAFLDSIGA